MKWKCKTAGTPDARGNSCWGAGNWEGTGQHVRNAGVVLKSDPRQIITPLVLVGLGLGVGEGEGLGLSNQDMDIMDMDFCISLFPVK